MQLVEGQGLVSASDLTGFLACGHLTFQERAATRGKLSRPERTDPELDILTQRGEQHEVDYLNTLAASGRGVVRLDLQHRIGQRRAAAASVSRTKRGVPK